MTTQVVIEGADDVVKKLKALGIDTARSQELILRAGAEVVKRRAADNVRGISTSTAESIKVGTLSRKADMVTVGVAPDTRRWYSVFIERGAKPHTVTRDRARVLKFVGTNGEFNYRRVVQHPGVKARPFMAPAADENHGEIVNAMADKAEAIILRVTA